MIKYIPLLMLVGCAYIPAVTNKDARYDQVLHECTEESVPDTSTIILAGLFPLADAAINKNHFKDKTQIIDECLQRHGYIVAE